MNVYYFNRHFGAVLRRLSVLFLRAGFAARDVPQSCSRLGRRSLGSAVSGWAVMAPLRYRFPRPSLAGRSPCTQGSKTCGVVSRYGTLVSALATAGIPAMISACHPVPVLPLSARRLCAPSATQTMISGRSADQQVRRPERHGDRAQEVDRGAGTPACARGSGDVTGARRGGAGGIPGRCRFRLGTRACGQVPGPATPLVRCRSARQIRGV